MPPQEGGKSVYKTLEEPEPKLVRIMDLKIENMLAQVLAKLERLENEIKALRMEARERDARSKAGSTEKNRRRTRLRPTVKKGVCVFHWRFKEKCKKCIPGCSQWNPARYPAWLEKPPLRQ